MFNVNGIDAVLVQNNRDTSSNAYYDDQDKNEIDIVVCPYNADVSVRFGTNTVAEAKGYFIVKADTPVKEGDELIVDGKRFSIIDLQDNWIWNKVANITLAVK